MGNGREAQMVVIERDENGVPTVWSDPEIVDLVRALNAGDVKTVASCSGHGVRPGNIALKDGRELIIAPDYETARLVEGYFPGINGEPALNREVFGSRHWWFRLPGGYGLHFRWVSSGYTPLFSERCGHVKVLKLGKLWIRILKP